MSNLVPVNVPDIGDVSDVDIIEVLVSVGDTIAKEDSLITLETDKATMDVPSSEAGVVKAIHVNVGDQVSQGDLILEIEASGEFAAASASSRIGHQQIVKSQPSEEKAAASASHLKRQHLKCPQL